LYAAEKETGARWSGERGNVSRMHAYAQKAHNGFLTVFAAKKSIQDINEQDCEHAAERRQARRSTLTERGLATVSMVLHVSNEGAPIHARLVQRLTLGGLDTSDINFFQMLHEERLTYRIQEDVAQKARVHFSNI